MKEYLRVQVGPFHFMLDATKILEIIELDEANEQSENYPIQQASDHISWRDQMLKQLSWQEILQVAGTHQVRYHIVYQPTDDDHPIVFTMEKIIGLLHLKSTEFLALPPLPEKLTQLFDQAYYDKEQQTQVMHLRTDLNLACIESYLSSEQSQQADITNSNTVNKHRDQEHGHTS